MWYHGGLYGSVERHRKRRTVGTSLSDLATAETPPGLIVVVDCGTSGPGLARTATEVVIEWDPPGLGATFERVDPVNDPRSHYCDRCSCLAEFEFPFAINPDSGIEHGHVCLLCLTKTKHDCEDWPDLEHSEDRGCRCEDCGLYFFDLELGVLHEQPRCYCRPSCCKTCCVCGCASVKTIPDRNGRLLEVSASGVLILSSPASRKRLAQEVLL